MSVLMLTRAIVTISPVKKTDIAFTIRTKPGTRVDDNYIIDYDEPKSSV